MARSAKKAPKDAAPASKETAPAPQDAAPASEEAAAKSETAGGPIGEFLSTIHGRLAVIAGVVGLVAGIFTQVTDVVSKVSSYIWPEKTVAATDQSNAITEQEKTYPNSKAATECLDVYHMRPNVIPHYLLHSVGSEHFPYWLRIIGTNKCKTNVIVKVIFEPKDPRIPIRKHKDKVFTAKRGFFSQIISPKFALLLREIDEMAIRFYVEEDSTGVKLAIDEISAEIVQPHTIAWDLKTPEIPRRDSNERQPGEPVDSAYLLGSLAAWTYKSPRAVAALGASCREGEDVGARLWGAAALRNCYERLFSQANGDAVSVLAAPIAFPDRPRQHVSPVATILKEKRGNVLEAALAFIAVFNRRRSSADPKLVLLIAPADAARENGKKTAFVAWQDDNTWSGVDLLKAASLSFDENVSASSNRISAILSDNPDLAVGIVKTGAAFSRQERYAAVEFRKARVHYKIQGLP